MHTSNITTRPLTSTIQRPLEKTQTIIIQHQLQSIQQASCYTLLNGFQPPWPPPCCLHKPYTFHNSCFLTAMSTTRASPVLLTKTSPL